MAGTTATVTMQINGGLYKYPLLVYTFVYEIYWSNRHLKNLMGIQ